MTDQPHTSPFDATRRVDEEGNEYWSARELSKLLGYSQWQKFQRALKDAIEACKQSGKEPSDDFTRVSEIVKAGATSKPKEDYHLSRYACYLVIQNADPEKPIVALGQTYFAVQTRRQELADELASLPEEQKRLILRSEMAIFNQQLNEAAQRAGVITPDDFATFTDHGYIGLYGGLREAELLFCLFKPQPDISGSAEMRSKRWNIASALSRGESDAISNDHLLRETNCRCSPVYT